MHTKQIHLKRFAVALLSSLLLLSVVVGCSTLSTQPTIIQPISAETETPSYDGAERNSGILSDAEGGFIVTPHFRDRYNALIRGYGNRFSHPLKKDDGVNRRGDVYFIDNQHMVYFLTMNQWFKSGI
jgi:hypothetical protein